MDETKRRPCGRRAALVLVNYQIDFLTGSRAVEGGNNVVTTTNAIRNAFYWDTVVRLEVSHDPRQMSFLSTHIIDGVDAALGDSRTLPDGSAYTLVPDHCVSGSEGAKLVPKLEVDASDHVVLAGTYLPGYSAFRDLQPDVKGVAMTNLNKHLRSNNITDVYVLGLGFEEMVSRTASDAKTLGYNTNVVTDMSLGWSPSAVLATKKVLEREGIRLLASKAMLTLNTDHKRSKASTYLEDHGITFIMEKLTAALVYQQPEDPRAFMLAELQKIDMERNAGNRLSLITFEELKVVFGMMDPLNKGSLSGQQIQQGLQGTAVNPQRSIDLDAMYDVKGFQDLVLREEVVVRPPKQGQSKKAVSMLRCVFNALDRDGNDNLTKAELWAAMEGSPLDGLLVKLDESIADDDVVPFDQFIGWFDPIPDAQVEVIRSQWLVNYFKQKHSAPVVDLLSRLFKKWDRDNSGVLVISEVAESMKNTTAFGGSADPEKNAEIQKRNIARIMRADTNGDDRISIQEFVAFMDDGIPDEHVPKLIVAFELQEVEPFDWETAVGGDVKVDVGQSKKAENMLRCVFLALDRDLNDRLSKAELWAAIKGSPLDNMLVTVDSTIGDDAIVSFDLFMGWFAYIPDDQVEVIRSRWLVNYFKTIHSALVIDLLSRLFKKWDSDNSGVLVISEVAESIKNTTAFGVSADPEKNAEIQKRNIARIMRADTNGDDRVSIQEFVAFMDDGILDKNVPALIKTFGLQDVDPFAWDTEEATDAAEGKAEVAQDAFTNYLAGVFGEIDTDKSGSISRKELVAKLEADDEVEKLLKAAGGLSTHYVMEQLDSPENGDDKITLTEFVESLKVANPATEAASATA